MRQKAGFVLTGRLFFYGLICRIGICDFCYKGQQRKTGLIFGQNRGEAEKILVSAGIFFIILLCKLVFVIEIYFSDMLKKGKLSVKAQAILICHLFWEKCNNHV